MRDVLTCFLTTGLDMVVVDEFVARRRPGDVPALDRLTVEFRPVTRLAEYRTMTGPDTYETCYEIYLDHPKGSRTEISPALFSMLRLADGATTVAALARAVGGLTDELRRELYDLWQSRFFVLRPDRTA